MKENEIVEEKEYLEHALKIIQEKIQIEQEELKTLFNDFIGNRDELWNVADKKKNHIKNLTTSLDKPYFARIDFASNDNDKVNKIYIGKNGVSNNTNIIITDWRAPISSLYYDAQIGQCSYEAPNGIISGNMSLKRQFEIEKGKMIRYFDVDLVSNDTLLQKYLNENNDSRLKNIVSTIQKEQNDVIRRKIENNLIIQGVAGSGKTTVALHRIAYLAYNYIKNIKQSQYLVIGPNPVFLKYIQSVLPELDVSGITQYTFEDFTQEYLEETIKISSSSKKAKDNISGQRNNSIDKFKCSMKYKEMLNEFLQLYFYSITSKPLMIGNFEVLSSKEITEVFKSTEGYNFSCLNRRIEMTIERLCKLIENRHRTILSRYNSYAYEVFKTANTDDEKNKLRNIFAKEKMELSKNCRTTLRKYFNKSRLNATKLYKLFISSIEEFDSHNYEEIKQLKKETMLNIRKGIYDFEDLAALIYIKSEIAPVKYYTKIRHVVIDEAQDLGEFNFWVLKKTLPSATFSIFGDIAQSIYDYRGINNWEEVNKTMFNSNAEIIKFNKSYRTTSEIMTIADDVAESIGLSRSDLVIRHGSPVELTMLSQENDIPKYIMKKIADYKQKGYKTIAVISKTDIQSKEINSELLKLGINIPNVSPNDDLTDDKFKICTISNQLAKGLEFDAVVINNASDAVYSSHSVLDMKLLYVAITRALHELNIVYTGELTKSLDVYSQLNDNPKILIKSGN